MHFVKGAALALLLLATAMAGCGGKTGNVGSCDAFCVTAPADPTQPYLFSATVTADNYTWDFGDNLGVGYGHDAQYTYDVQNAKLVPKLYATTAGKTVKYEHKDADAIVRGTGINQPGTYLLEAETNWAVTGQMVKFSARSSHDPDGDVMRFAWACTRTGDAIPKAPHSHGPLPPPFVSPKAGSITAGMANHTLPAADRIFDATTDVCTDLGTIGTQRLSAKDTTIEGSFQKQGIYDVFLIAADPAHPTVSGQFEFVVTAPADRPNATLAWTFSGDFTAGANGVLKGAATAQQGCDAANSGKTCDVYVSHFLPPIGQVVTWVNFTYDIGPGGSSAPPQAQYQAKWRWENGPIGVSSGGPLQGTTLVDNSLTQTAPASPYTMRVTAEQGVAAPAPGTYHFQVILTSKMDLDPYKLYF